jgi:hypothetical protein
MINAFIHAIKKFGNAACCDHVDVRHDATWNDPSFKFLVEYSAHQPSMMTRAFVEKGLITSWQSNTQSC